MGGIVGGEDIRTARVSLPESKRSDTVSTCKKGGEETEESRKKYQYKRENLRVFCEDSQREKVGEVRATAALAWNAPSASATASFTA